MRYCLIVVLATATPAWADSVTVLFSSDPIGASVYANSNEQPFGYAPVTLKYELPKGFLKGSACQTMQPVKVRWVSGAEAQIEPDICPGSGKKQQFVFQRPVQVPGADIDATFAIQVQQLMLARQQQRASDFGRALSDAFYNMAEQARRRADIAERTRLKLLNCTSTLVGDTVYTNCF